MRASIVVCLILATGCHHAHPPPPAQPVAKTAPAPTAAATPAPAPAIAALPCEHDPGIDQSPPAMLACARAEYDAHDYDAADARAAIIMSHYPYSKMAVDAQVLRADVLFARGQYADAAEAYGVWLRLHPTYPEVDAVKHKQADATARAQAPRPSSFTGR